MTFEQSITRLEQIVGALDGDGIELARALELFEEGIAQLRLASTELQRADAKVRQLVEQSDGSFSVDDLDA